MAPAWETNPDATTTYDLLLPEGVVAAQLGSPTDAGTAQFVLVKSDNGGQSNGLGGFANRPADVPSDQDPNKAQNSNGGQLEALHVTPFAPAIDARGNANCQIGQWGYLRGPLHPKNAHGPYPPAKSIPGDNGFATFQNTLAGDLFYATLLFGGFKVAEVLAPGLRANIVQAA